MQTIVRATASGEMHGLINTLSNSVPYDDFKSMKPDIKAKCEKEKKDDARMVKVEYFNTRGRHERLTKTYCRWAGEPLLQYHLIPGQQYEVPYGFVKEVNEIKMPIRSGLVSVDGQSLNKDESPLNKDQEGERIHRLLPVSY